MPTPEDPSRDDRCDAPAIELLRLYFDRDGEAEEREAALSDARVPDSLVLVLLAALPRHGNRRVALIARCDRPRVLAELANSDLAEDRRLVAFNPATSAEVVRRLAEDPDELVRANVAYNPNADSGVLELLAADSSDDVRQALGDALGSDLGQYLRGGQRSVSFDEEGDE